MKKITIGDLLVNLSNKKISVLLEENHSCYYVIYSNNKINKFAEKIFYVKLQK